MRLKIIDQIVKKGLNVKKTEQLVEKILEEDKMNVNIEENKYKWAINPRIITNTLKQIMDKNGIEAQYKHKEKDDCLEIIVRIPKV